MRGSSALALVLVMAYGQCAFADNVFYYFPKNKNTVNKGYKPTMPNVEAPSARLTEEKTIQEPGQPAAPAIRSQAPPDIPPMAPVAAPPVLLPTPETTRSAAVLAVPNNQKQPTAYPAQNEPMVVSNPPPLSTEAYPQEAQQQNAPVAQTSSHNQQTETPHSLLANANIKAGIDAGYNVDSLEWTTEFDTAPVGDKGISALNWTNIRRYEVAPHVEYTQKGGGLYLEASGHMSTAFSGKNQDSDTLVDSGTPIEFSRTNNSSDAGYSKGINGSVGYAFDFAGDREQAINRFIALAGYSRMVQRFVIRDGNQTLANATIFDTLYDEDPPDLGPFSDLRSSYDTDWSLPFVGGEYNFLSGVHRFKLRGQYYRGFYRGVGNWNLSPDYVPRKSFKQSGTATGYQMGIEYGWMIYPKTELTLSSSYMRLSVKDGKDTVFPLESAPSTSYDYDAEYTSQKYRVGVTREF